MKSTSEVVEGVRAWAKGAYPLEAGVELLIPAGPCDLQRGAMGVRKCR